MIDEEIDIILYTIINKYRWYNDLPKTITFGRKLLKTRFKIQEHTLKKEI
jgi:hypothetical protein